MLRANLMPGQKIKKSLNGLDRGLLWLVVVVLIFFGGTHAYTLYKSKIANENLKASIQEEAGYAAEKAAYYDNKALAQKTYDLEKALDTGVTAQVNENFILSNIANYMLPDTYLDKITFVVDTGTLVMDFRSISFEHLSKVFINLLTDTKIVGARVGGYSLPLKALNATNANPGAISKDATMQITATWVGDNKITAGTPPALTVPTASPENADTTTTPGGTP